ncbi:hypothetical protein [Streptomyces morookaense]|uniref:Uncharacterized protein n=1 Tax=Streptomyces morookaense TaxID=1970 RepID=A0A7Y7B4E9_STRMO|nr:hypothetical protein [Streptomyces morookaense]NVK78401.1 hypothetical protein [Streptomyces morookaense]GHF49849.1 hypothetical protein GCM10010359_60320 [Streptomyces morookaense]
MRAAQRALAAEGFVCVPGLWGRELADGLAAEASACRPHARIPANGPRTPVTARRRGTPAANGPLLARLHLGLTGTARALSGRLLVPTFAAYGYYEGDDAVYLHTDTAQCDLTLLTTACGEVGPLHVHPELAGRTMAELGSLESDPSWDRASGTPVRYPATGIVALAGHRIPHHRPGRPAPGLNAVAALCYRALY